MRQPQMLVGCAVMLLCLVLAVGLVSALVAAFSLAIL